VSDASSPRRSPKSEWNDDAPPHARVVLLGASNVTRGISTLVETIRLALGSPLDILVAYGHGRSYGIDSCVLGRRLVGIVHCGLWEALAGRSRLPTYALLTDVGNDLVYGASVQQISAWVETCLARLAEVGAENVLGRLPVENLYRVSPWHYRAARRLLFPRSDLSLNDARRAATALDEALVVMAERFGATLVAPRATWYGIDPIHVKMRRWNESWREFVSSWPVSEKNFSPPRGSLRRWVSLRRLWPAQRWLFGREQRAEQPVGRLNDGTQLSLY